MPHFQIERVSERQSSPEALVGEALDPRDRTRFRLRAVPSDGAEMQRKQPLQARPLR
jgi:hypothetical protein